MASTASTSSGCCNPKGVKFEDYRAMIGVSISKRKLIERELRPLAAVSDEDVKNFYYTDTAFRERQKEQKLVLSYSLQQLLLPQSALAETAQKRLRAGEDFDSVSSDLASQGAESSTLPTLSEENMNSKIRDAIKGLKVGEVTKPIATGSGYMILKVSQIGAPKDPVFEKRKEEIREQLYKRALLNQLQLWTERAKTDSYVHVPT